MRGDRSSPAKITLPSPFRHGELAVDARGHLWVSLVMLGDIALSRGVARWDGREWTQWDKDSGLGNAYVEAISTDAAGNVWLAHMLGDLSCWDGTGWSYFPGGEAGRPREALGRALEDRAGRLWFPSRAGVVVAEG